MLLNLLVVNVIHSMNSCKLKKFLPQEKEEQVTTVTSADSP